MNPHRGKTNTSARRGTATAVLLAAMCVLAGRAIAAEPPAAEKLLLGFEADEVRRIVQALKIPEGGNTYQRLTEVEGGFDLKNYYVFGKPWCIRDQRASQGKLALHVRATGYPLPTMLTRYSQVPCCKQQRPMALFPWYGGMEVSADQGVNTCGVFRDLFPTDWSGYDLLRLDCYCEAVAQTIRVVLEDEDIEPPVVRNVEIQPGRWTTVEVDLRAAAKERGLDPRRMATMFVFVVKGRPISTWMDNIRLARAGAAAALPVARDDSPQAAPAQYAASRPTPEPAGPAPDRSPIAAEPPFVINITDELVLRGGLGTSYTATSRSAREPVYLSVSPCGWAAAYDNRRLLVGFTAFGGRNVYALQSVDGGKRWTGLDGGETPTMVPVPNPDHGSGRGDVVGRRADVLLLTNLGCAGTAKPAMRVYSQKLTFTGDGWQLRPEPALFDSDPRHCTSNQSILRLPGGRLWAAHGVVGRLGVCGINARFSDDDGVTWKPWRAAEGKSGALPGSFQPEAGVGGIGTYVIEEPCLVRDGAEGLACFWYHLGPQRRLVELKWSRFDGRTWSAAQTIEPAAPVAGQAVASRPPVHAVSLAGREFFVVSTRFAGVLHYADGTWTKEAPDIPAGARISVAGDKAVLVFHAGPRDPKARDGGIVIRCWQRAADGSWPAPRQLAAEDAPLTMSKNRPSFVVQTQAPPNFVPIAWTCRDKTWIKFLRVPVLPAPPP